MIRLHRNSSIIGQTLRLVGLVIAIALSACGTLDTPKMHEATEGPAIEEADVTSSEEQPTLEPTMTPIPPTETPVPLPTETPTTVHTATPEPTAAPVLSPIDRLVAVRNPENGAILFETFQDAANYSCANCHSPTSEKTLIGPGLLNIKTRALTRVEGQSAAEYVYESITDSKAYLVEGFDEDLMPQNWAEIYSDLEIFDIVAYVLTLEGRSDINDPDPEPEESDSETEEAESASENAESDE